MKNFKVVTPLITITAALMMNNVNAVEGEIKQIAISNGCTTCHSIEPENMNANTKPIAPSFTDIAKRFHSNEGGDYPYLVNVIKNGSNPYKSNWKGKVTGVAMPPNKDIMSDYEINKILVGILSLDNSE